MFNVICPELSSEQIQKPLTLLIHKHLHNLYMVNLAPWGWSGQEQTWCILFYYFLIEVN